MYFHIFLKSYQFPIEWNIGYLRNKPDIIVWICGSEFVSFWTPNNILNNNDEYDFHFCYSRIHTHTLITPNSNMSNFWNFCSNARIRRDRNTLEKVHFEQKHFEKPQFHFHCAFQSCGQIQGVTQERTYIWWLTFLRCLVYFQTISKWSHTSPRSFHFQTKYKNITS